MPERILFPRSVDVNPTSKCNLSCSMCWGPNHNTPDQLTTGDWMRTIKFFSENGTDAIVFTGGEPLLRKDILKLLKYSKQMGMRITLSTNTILLFPNHVEALPFLDELGIPMDASSPERNLKMREGGINSFTFQLNALYQAKGVKPELDVTIRTVASKKNLDDLPSIGRVLEHYWGKFDRWKIYQFSPFSYGKASEAEHSIPYAKFLTACNELRATFPRLKIDAQSSSFGEGRYAFVGSQGDIYGVGDGKYLFVGNLLNDTQERIKRNIREVFDPDKNREHAHK